MMCLQVGCPESGVDDAVARLTAAGYKVQPCHHSLPAALHSCLRQSWTHSWPASSLVQALWCLAPATCCAAPELWGPCTTAHQCIHPCRWGAWSRWRQQKRPRLPGAPRLSSAASSAASTPPPLPQVRQGMQGMLHPIAAVFASTAAPAQAMPAQLLPQCMGPASQQPPHCVLSSYKVVT